MRFRRPTALLLTCTWGGALGGAMPNAASAQEAAASPAADPPPVAAEPTSAPSGVAEPSAAVPAADEPPDPEAPPTGSPDSAPANPYATAPPPPPATVQVIEPPPRESRAARRAGAQPGPYASWTREELEAERAKNGTALPIVVLSVGGGAAFLGLTVSLSALAGPALSSFHGGLDEGQLKSGAFLLVSGSVAALCGTFWLTDRLATRNAIQAELDARAAAPSARLAVAPVLAPLPGGGFVGISGNF